MTWSVLSFAWLLCGEDEIKLADPPDEPATVLLDPWLVKSDWDELSLRLGNWSCDALLEDNEGLWNWMSPFGLALNDWERSMIRKSMKIIWLFYKLSSIYWEINFQSEKIEKQWKTARVNFFCLFLDFQCVAHLYMCDILFSIFSLSFKQAIWLSRIQWFYFFTNEVCSRMQSILNRKIFEIISFFDH